MRLFIGYDSNEVVAYHVLVHSILSRASVPVSITPLKIDQLPMTRPREAYQSTEFSFSRFLVPWLSNYQGVSIFMDCDMLVQGDIKELIDRFDSRYAVQVVKHNYQPKTENKFLDQPQALYEKKNWSSVMLFNNDRCRKLTPQFVDEASGLTLHQFKWLAESEIGELPKSWNHLVGEDGQEDIGNARLIHYTLGTPCFKKYSRGPEADLWYLERESMLHYDNRGEFSRELRTGT